MDNRRPTQAARVLHFMARYGSITQLESLEELGVLRLASRISELKKAGWPIESQMVAVTNRYGEKCRVKKYFLSTKESKQCLNME